MLIIKTLHIFFVISWFACLFYLPRLFVNHAMVTADENHKLLLKMERKLIKMMTFTLWATMISAFMLVYVISGGNNMLAYLLQTWMLMKMAFVVLLIFYHSWCITIHFQFVNNTQKRSHLWFRWFNEMPIFILLVIIYLVLAKPF